MKDLVKEREKVQRGKRWIGGQDYTFVLVSNKPMPALPAVKDNIAGHITKDYKKNSNVLPQRVILLTNETFPDYVAKALNHRTLFQAPKGSTSSSKVTSPDDISMDEGMEELEEGQASEESEEGHASEESEELS